MSGDQSGGDQGDGPKDGGGKKALGQILLQRKLVSPNELEALLNQSRESTDRLASVAMDTGTVTARDLLESLSEQHGLPAVDLDQRTIDLRVLDVVPEQLAKRDLILPLERTEAVIFVAMADPGRSQLIEEIEFTTGLQVFSYVALHASIRRTIDEAYLAASRGERYHFGASVPLARRREASHMDLSAAPIPGDGATFTAQAMADPSDVFSHGLGDTAVYAAISLPQKQNNPHLDRALSAYARKALVEAVSELQEAIQVDPDCQLAYYYLGLVYGRNDKPYEAAKILERAVSLQPDHFDCLKSLAIIYQRIGYNHHAYKTWQRALEHAPDPQTRTKIQEYLARAVEPESN